MIQLSEKTIAILKNFSSIGTGIIFQPGHQQMVVAKDNTIVGEVTLTEEFPVEFGVFKLSEFINNVTLFSTCQVDFSPHVAVIGDETFSVHYRASSPNLILGQNTPSFEDIKRRLALPEPKAEFVLPAETLAKIVKVASMNVLSHVSIKNEGDELSLRAFEKDNDGSNEAKIKVSTSNTPDFESVFLLDHLNKLLANTAYNVKVGPAFTKFESHEGSLVYTIANQTMKK